MPPARSRNGSHSSDAFGTPCSHSTGVPSRGALRHATSIPPTSAVCSSIIHPDAQLVCSAAMSAGRLPAVPRSEWRRPAARRLRAIRDRLRELYGRPAAPPHGQGVDELVLTVLSQSTNDRNRDVAFLRLRDRFGSWAAVRDAPLADVEDAIQPGGLHRQKSVRIQQILRELPDEISLDWLADAPVEEGRAALTALPGVGRKTAACVLLFAYGKPDVPVDTHVSRVGTRLGLFRPGAPFSELHDDMLALVGGDRRGRRGRAGARAAREPPAPRAPHLPRAAAGVRRVRAAPDVPVRSRPARICANATEIFPVRRTHTWPRRSASISGPPTAAWRCSRAVSPP